MIGFAGWMAVATASLVLSAVAEPPDNPIFPPEATLEPLLKSSTQRRSGLTEGPAASPDGSIYFTDIPGGQDTQTTIYRFDPGSEKTTVYTAKGSKANGLTFDAQGRLLLCDGAEGGRRQVARWNLKTDEHTVLAERWEGKRLNSPNDLCVDRQRRIYFTDPRYGGIEPRELKHCSVYRIDPDGTLALLTGEVEMPNGIVLSPDQRTLYVDDYRQRRNPSSTEGPAPGEGALVYAFPLSRDGQIDGPRRTLIELGKDENCDGMTVDAAGNVYVTCRNPAKPGVLVVDPEGKRLAFLLTGPENQKQGGDLLGIPSNVEFGVGQDRHTLYLTIDTGFFRIRTKATGAPRVWEAAKP